MKVLLTDPKAIEALEKALRTVNIYRYAESYCRVGGICFLTQRYLLTGNVILQCRDTFWVESFNHQLLTYLPKRIHFTTDTFHMCMNLAVCDWVSVL